MARKLIFVLLIIFVAGVAGAANTPKYLNYQAVLFDEGGNPLPDGPTNLSVRILDSNMNVIFEEEQEVEVISGVVSLMIGNGMDPASGTLTGGISAETLLPDGPRYLEVQAEGYPAENLMELVSVPYSTYADVAFKVADESVGADQIREKSITINHLTDELVSELGNQIVGGDQITIVKKEEFNEYKNEISGSGGARSVGVNPDLTYTSAANLQDVLKDLDFAIKKREEDAVKVDENNLSRDGSDVMTGDIVMAADKKVDGIDLSWMLSDINNVPEQLNGSKLVDATISESKLASGSVTTAKIANSNVTTAKIADSNVTTAKIADSNVTTAKIADSSVTTAKIADGGVTNAKLADAKVSKNGSTMTGSLVMQNSSIELGGYLRSKWSGFKWAFRRTHSQTYDNCDADPDTDLNCTTEDNGNGFVNLKVISTCESGEVLLGCSGFFKDCAATGDWACQYMGSIPVGNKCESKGIIKGCCGDRFLYSHAICGVQY